MAGEQSFIDGVGQTLRATVETVQNDSPADWTAGIWIAVVIAALFFGPTILQAVVQLVSLMVALVVGVGKGAMPAKENPRLRGMPSDPHERMLWANREGKYGDGQDDK